MLIWISNLLYLYNNGNKDEGHIHQLYLTVNYMEEVLLMMAMHHFQLFLHLKQCKKWEKCTKEFYVSLKCNNKVEVKAFIIISRNISKKWEMQVWFFVWIQELLIIKDFGSLVLWEGIWNLILMLKFYKNHYIVDKHPELYPKQWEYEIF